MKNLTFLLLVLIFSCKNDTKSKIVEEENVESINYKLIKNSVIDNNNLNIKMKFKSNKADLFQFVFKNKDSSVKHYRVYKDLKSTDTIQEMIGKYDLEKHDFPLSVMFILGHKVIKDVEIDQIYIESDGNVLNINNENLKDFFILNKFIEFDGNKIRSKKINEKHLPIMVLNKKALDSLSI